MMKNNIKASTLDEKVINRSGIIFFHLFNAWFEVRELEFLAQGLLGDIQWVSGIPELELEDRDYVKSLMSKSLNLP